MEDDQWCALDGQRQTTRNSGRVWNDNKYRNDVDGGIRARRQQRRVQSSRRSAEEVWRWKIGFNHFLNVVCRYDGSLDAVLGERNTWGEYARRQRRRS